MINKPSGMISKDVSRWVQRNIGRFKMGHVGTLDPLASGVLPLVFGRATRLQDYMLEGYKVYEFTIKLGHSTSTLDSEGEVVASAEWSHVEESDIKSLLPEMIGVYKQVPPIYSAIKYRGKALYEYARSGREEEVPLEQLSKDVRIYGMELLKFEGNLVTLSMTCSKGTYVRTVANDLASRLNTLGHIVYLHRVAASGFNLTAAVDFEDLEKSRSLFFERLIPLEEIPLPLNRWRVRSESDVRRLKTGLVVNVEAKHFYDCLVKCEEASSLPEGVGNVVFLQDRDGSPIGLGMYNSLSCDRIQVKMKRGL